MCRDRAIQAAVRSVLQTLRLSPFYADPDRVYASRPLVAPLGLSFRLRVELWRYLQACQSGRERKIWLPPHPSIECNRAYAASDAQTPDEIRTLARTHTSIPLDSQHNDRRHGLLWSLRLYFPVR